MARCLVGCGSNLGNRREQLDRAVELLRFMPGVVVVAASRYRETRPVGGPAGQHPFLNGACLIETDLPPRDLLGALFAVENTLHRRRDDRWGERTIDLDLLLYDEVVIDSPALTLPHPRLTTRRFVLEPAVEIAADLRHPFAACTLRALLDNISHPHPLVSVVGVPGSGAPEVAAAVGDALMARVVHSPTPLFKPGAGRDAARWRETLASWTRPLESADWADDPHGTIADFWIGALPTAAAEDLPRDELDLFEAECDRATERTIAPHVAIMLVAGAEMLEERMAFCAREGSRASDVFADLAPAAAAVCESTADSVAHLLRLQDRLVRRLRCPDERRPRTPKAVVLVDAADLTQAVAEATAAVEAMV